MVKKYFESRRKRLPIKELLDEYDASHGYEVRLDDEVNS